MSTTNTCTSLAASLKWCPGKAAYPGMRGRLYVIDKKDIVAWPQPATDALGRVTSGTLVGNFTIATDRTWKAIDILVDKSTVTSEAQGEAPSQTQLNKATLVHPATDEIATAAAGWLNNSDLVFIIQDMDGKFRVIGNDKWNTKVTMSQDLGQGAAGNAATTINIEATDVMPAPFYTGPIVTEDGTINEPTNYTVSLTCTQGDGTVQVDTETASASCSKTVAAGTVVTIKAIAGTGKTFEKWSDNDTNATRAIAVNAATALTASFVASGN